MPIKRPGANTVLSVTLLDTRQGNTQLVVRRRKRERLAQFDGMWACDEGSDFVIADDGVHYIFSVHLIGASL